MNRGWIELFRPPNAFTLPGDVMAGAWLAGVAAGTGWLPLLPASLCLYFGGLALNDWFDRERDAIERPSRPIPSGRVSPGAALTTGTLLLVAGVALAALVGPWPSLVAAAIAVLVVLYDGPARSVPLLAFLVMGLCRGGNLLLGASPALPTWKIAVVVAAAVETAYILAVTAAAKRETEGPPAGLARWAPLATVVVGLPLVLAFTRFSVIGLLAAVVATIPVFLLCRSFRPELPAAAVPPRIGALIRALIPIQAAFVLAAAPTALLPAAGLYALWPLGRAAGRRFYGS